MNLKFSQPFALQVVMACSLSAQQYNESVRIVSNRSEIRAELRGLHIAFDALFALSDELSTQPRDHFSEYFRSQVEKEKNADRLRSLKKISSRSDRYVWYCAGFTRKSKRFVLCQLIASEVAKEMRTNQTAEPGHHFPIIHDGGTLICQAVFDISTKTFTLLRWNGEA